MRTPRILLLAALVVALAAPAASAATYYVDDSGSDSNPGTYAAPFRTITYGLGKLKVAGDVLYVRGGTYNERCVIWSKYGADGNPIRVEGYNNEQPIIDGTGIGARSTVSINTSAYIHFSGFIVQNAPDAGIRVWDAHHVTVENNTVRTAFKAGITAGTDTVGNTHDIIFRNNIVTDTVRENAPGTMTSGWQQAMSCYKSYNVLFTNNTIHQNYGEGIDCIVSDNCTITKNTIWDNKGSNIYLDNAQYSLVDSNFIYHTGDSRFFRDGAPSPGITVANEYYDVQNPSTNLTITNNIVRSCNVGFVYYNSEYGRGMHFTLIANNTFYHSVSTTARLIYIEDGPTPVHDTTTIDNNIFYQRSGVGFARAPTAGITWQTNNWYGGTAGTQITGAGDVLADPLLVNPGGSTPDDYKLTAGSPVAGAGTVELTVTKDFFGNTRTVPYSIGAHEY